MYAGDGPQHVSCMEQKAKELDELTRPEPCADACKQTTADEKLAEREASVRNRDWYKQWEEYHRVAAVLYDSIKERVVVEDPSDSDTKDTSKDNKEETAEDAKSDCSSDIDCDLDDLVDEMLENSENADDTLAEWADLSEELLEIFHSFHQCGKFIRSLETRFRKGHDRLLTFVKYLSESTSSDSDAKKKRLCRAVDTLGVWLAQVHNHGLRSACAVDALCSDLSFIREIFPPDYDCTSDPESCLDTDSSEANAEVEPEDITEKVDVVEADLGLDGIVDSVDNLKLKSDE